MGEHDQDNVAAPSRPLVTAEQARDMTAAARGDGRCPARRVDLGDRHRGAGDPAVGEDGVELVAAAAQKPGEAGFPQLLEARFTVWP